MTIPEEYFEEYSQAILQADESKISDVQKQIEAFKRLQSIATVTYPHQSVDDASNDL